MHGDPGATTWSDPATHDPKAAKNVGYGTSVAGMPEHPGAVTFDDLVDAHSEPLELSVEAPPGGLALAPRPALERHVDDEPPGSPGGGPSGRPPTGVRLTRSHAAGLLSGFRDAGPVAIAGFLANGANVVVTLLVARLLTTRGYGALAQLTSVFLVVSMPGTAVVVAVVRRATATAMGDQVSSVAGWARTARSRAGAVLALACVAAFAARGEVAHALSIPAPLGVFAAVAAGSVWVLLCLDRGLLEARQAYRTLSVNLIVEGAMRTVFVLCLVGAGLGVTGAAFGILVAELVTAAHARATSNRIWHISGGLAIGLGASTTVARRIRRPFAQGGAAWLRTRRVVVEVGSALVAMALLAYLQNVDVIVLGREAPRSSGPYAAISVASKALVFGATALGGYLLPEAAIEWHRGNHALRQLLVTLLVLAVPGTVLLVAAIAFPQRLLSLVFSARYVSDHSAFGTLALAMVFLSVTVILTLYLLASGHRWIGGVLLVGAVIATFVLSMAHGRPDATATADLAVQGALAATTGCAFAVAHTKRAARSFAGRLVA